LAKPCIDVRGRIYKKTAAIPDNRITNDRFDGKGKALKRACFKAFWKDRSKKMPVF
jgi:hypothetical protein